MKLDDLKEKTYYEMLGVEFDAPIERVKEVYHDLARVFHPDSNFYDEIVPQKASAEQVQVFKIITAAYNTLIDPEKRAAYNQQVSPLFSGKLKSWDDKQEDFFAKNERAMAEAAKNPNVGRERKATGTFGREELLREAERNERQESTLSTFGDLRPVSQMVNLRKGLDKSSLILIGIGIIVGIAVIGAILIILKRH